MPLSNSGNGSCHDQQLRPGSQETELHPGSKSSRCRQNVRRQSLHGQLGAQRWRRAEMIDVEPWTALREFAQDRLSAGKAAEAGDPDQHAFALSPRHEAQRLCKYTQELAHERSRSDAEGPPPRSLGPLSGGLVRYCVCHKHMRDSKYLRSTRLFGRRRRTLSDPVSTEGG